MSNQAGKMYPARHVVVYCGLLAMQLLLLLVGPRALNGLKLDSASPRHHVHQLDRSGWLMMTATSGHQLNLQEPQTDDGEPQGLSAPSRYKKLIEWDDDENNSSNSNSLGGGVSSSLVLPYEDSQGQQEIQRKQPTSEASNGKSNPKWPKKSGKLVFHGTLKNSTNRTVGGIKLHINTHRPVPITRSEPQQQHGHRITGRNMMVAREQPEVVSPQDVDDRAPRLFSQPAMESPAPSKRPSLAKKNKLYQAGLHNSLQSPAEPGAFSYSKSSNSDWRPLLTSFARAAASNRKRSLSKTDAVSLKHEADESKLALDSKWRPIALTKKVDTKRDGLQLSHHKSTIEEPFDDENTLTENTSTPQPSARESKSLSQKSRWTPVDTTTTTSVADTTFTTTISSITTTTSLPTTSHSIKLSPKHNSSESTQLRSASDLNYIYSSQPSGSPVAPTDWQPRAPTATSNGYYSTAYQQQQPISSTLVDQQPTFPAGAIVDTTSGQTPETSDSRSESQAQQAEFSLPFSSATFQPAQAPPVRSQAIPAAYGVGYDNSAYYYSAAPVAQPQRQVLASPSPSPNQFVRQEHHYHYYNNQQRQQQQQPAQVVREIQPVVISQPYIQPVPSPTPSPQIIREIIKEVPMQTVQLQPVQVPRIIVPPRELEPSYYPAQRIIRQISGSIPSVGVRQIRLPLPTIQLPVRLAAANVPAPVTRQTGSYIIPPLPQKTTTYLTETQAMPTHTTIMHTTQFTPATRTTVYTTDHQPPPAPAQSQTLAAATGYKRR